MTDDHGHTAFNGSHGCVNVHGDSSNTSCAPDSPEFNKACSSGGH